MQSSLATFITIHVSIVIISADY